MLKLAVILGLAVIPSAFAQMAISLRSGLIHHLEGRATLEGTPVTLEFGKFASIPEGKTLTTLDGRAEVLLNPGVFLRLGAQSSIRMIANDLTNTRVEIPKGSAMVEVVELAKEHQVNVKLGQSHTKLLRNGLYLFDADSGQVRVFDGKAQVSLNDVSLELGKGKQAEVSSNLVAGKFSMKDKERDTLYAWSGNRALTVASANLSASTALHSNGYRGVSPTGWAWYPGMGMLTYLPRSGYLLGSFGYAYYNPNTVWRYYAARNDGNYGYGGNRGGNGGGAQSSWSGMGASASRGGGYSGGGGSVMSGGNSGAGRAAAPAAAAPAVSSSGGARGR